MSQRAIAPSNRTVLAPGTPREIDPLLVTACERLQLDVRTVLAWGLYADRIVVIASDGRKLEVAR